MTSRVSLLTAMAAFVTLALVIVSSPTLGGQAALTNPAEATEQSPAMFRVNFDTNKGPFVVEVHRDWAPIGSDHLYNLVKLGFFDGQRFYRVTDLMAQFGIHGEPEIAKAWLSLTIADDPAPAADAYTEERVPGKGTNKRGYVAFSQPGENRRSTHVMINLGDNSTLDSMIVPFGQVVSGMNVVEQLYSGYGELAPSGDGPMLTPLYADGNAYLEKEFPRLDYIKTATLEQ